MHRSMSILSKTWFELAKKVNGIIFSFIFFWRVFSLLPYITSTVSHYFEHLGNKTGNTIYYTLEAMTKDLSIILIIVSGLAPFIISGILLNIIGINEKGKKK